MNVGTSDERIVSIRPALDRIVSKGHLCVKGRYAFDFLNAADRITEPMIRERGNSRTVSVRVGSRYGEAILTARIRRSLQSGRVFATFHTPEAFLNRVTSSYRDSQVKTPEYKITAVGIEKLG